MALFDFMKKRRVELLAPAGNYESFLGAIAAGADAVYLGGEKFGARAYADNFSNEEICHAISYAHIFQKKVYLTVNTLIKDKEFSSLIPYLEPFYLAGLDGVIVQDIGAFQAIRESFPDLGLHVSTQMTLTGSYGVKMLQKLGAVRIVPARELSLNELTQIKKETGIEIEAFIHGAMCYAYSGQCLFSSILGGRSGNRGRCAQPCRLPYQIVRSKKLGIEQYPLSLKDMCTISFLPKLIEGGIDSFKIEGRMKKPEYAAGVTAIYRKYIDLYYAGETNYQVSEADLQKLSSLYIRSQLQDGYYFKHNSKDMVTLQSPAYSGSNDQLLFEIRKRYIEVPLKKKISMYAEFKIGEDAVLTLLCENETPPFSITVKGKKVASANKQPITEENIRSGLQKLGNTAFFTEPSDIFIDAEENIFYPLKAINDLRREGILLLEKSFCEYNRAPLSHSLEDDFVKHPTKEKINKKDPSFRILISDKEQLDAVWESDIVFDSLYLESNIPEMSINFLKECRKMLSKKSLNAKIFIALPYIIRSKDMIELDKITVLMQDADGCLIRNLETYQYLTEHKFKGEIATDAGIYCFNEKSLDFWIANADRCCLPYELNKQEIRQLLSQREGLETEQNVYGYIPLMITANCISNLDKCRKNELNQDGFFLKDRYKNDFPVSVCCNHCYNVIYNTIPLSLHEKVSSKIIKSAMRLNFTGETKQETGSILRFFDGLQNNREEQIPYAKYTLGHEKRGVE